MNKDLRELFRELADMPPGQRAQEYQRRQVPADLKAELESLLAFDDSPSIDPLGASVGAAAEDLLESGWGWKSGDRVGPYRLRQLLGSGGMGTVFLAERADGEIEQVVAIKLLRAQTNLPSLRERFLRERQILAQLHHPGIARLLDAGTATGHPYLVMEYVNGIRIDEYAATLSLPAIVRLFVKVTNAVAYAHRNLIIHCDLKPSNILIDGSGEAKLLDFGIAKMLDAPGDTRTIERILTPEFASPEQLRGYVNSTSTDIYSLGAILAKLLASQRTGTVNADLKAIVAQAMRQEPEERYASAELLSQDLQAYLENRPVAARRGNALYSTRKFLRRYWLATTAAALGLIGLSSGLWIAQKEKNLAQRRFNEVRQIAAKFLDVEQSIRNLPGSTGPREKIVADSLDYLERLGKEAHGDAGLSLEIGRAYLNVARVQGVPGYPTLGKFADARKSLASAERIVEKALPSLPASEAKDGTFLLAQIEHDSMVLTQTLQENDIAAQHAAKAALRLEEFLRFPAAEDKEGKRAAPLFVNVGLANLNMHHMENAIKFASRAVELARQSGSSPAELSRALSVLGNARRFSGDLTGARTIMQEARLLAEKGFNPSDSGSMLILSAAHWREGLLLGEKDNINLALEKDAIPSFEKALQLSTQAADKDSKDYSSRTYIAMAGNELGDLLRDRDPRAALRTYDYVIKRLSEIPSNRRINDYLVWANTGSTYALRRLRQPAEAQRRLDAALELLKKGKQWPATSVLMGQEADAYLRALAEQQLATGKADLAWQTYKELERLIAASQPHPGSDLRHANGISRLYDGLAKSAIQNKLPEEATAYTQRRTALWKDWDRKLPNNSFVLRQLAALQP